MKKQIKRFLEIAAGVFLILLGTAMLATPGPGIVAVIAGIFLISPYHGRRVVWRLGKIWKRAKMFWYSWQFKRTVKRKIFRRAAKLKNKIIKK